MAGADKPTPAQIRGTLLPTRPAETSPQDENFSVLYTGFPKSGKTHCMCSWPEPSLYLYTDQNTATVRKHDQDYVVIEDWLTWKDHVAPALAGRQWFDQEGELVPFPYRTIVLDTVSSLGDYLLQYLKDVKHLDLSDNSFEIWNVFLTNLMPTMRALARLATPKTDQPSAHVLVGCHLHADGGRVASKKSPVPVPAKIKLDVVGRSSEHLPKLFNTIVLCKKEVEWTTGNPKSMKGNKYFCYTIDPSTLFNFLGDGVGGGKKYKTLPPKTGGTYQELMDAWGVQLKEKV